jgi:hypothetical protein
MLKSSPSRRAVGVREIVEACILFEVMAPVGGWAGQASDGCDAAKLRREVQLIWIQSVHVQRAVNMAELQMVKKEARIMQ